MLDRLPASADRQALKDFCNKDEQRDDEGREDFANGEGGDNGDGHREFHRHTTLHDIFVSFVEYRKSANESTDYADGRGVWISPTPYKPDNAGSRRHEQYATDLTPTWRMPVVLIVFVTQRGAAFALLSAAGYYSWLQFGAAHSCALRKRPGGLSRYFK
jgi:hypothetical protein